jgi:hypothetical protein
MICRYLGDGVPRFAVDEPHQFIIFKGSGDRHLPIFGVMAASRIYGKESYSGFLRVADDSPGNEGKRYAVRVEKRW